jgi:hypothetical protein
MSFIESELTEKQGNVTLNMIVGGIVVGQGRINNVMLTPGNNTVPIRATLDIKTALANLPAIFASQVNALKAGNVEISASGNSTIYNGQHIDYYETVLNKLVVTGQVPIVQLLIDTAAEFLGADPSAISGLLGSLNITGIIDSLNGISGGDSSSTGSSDLFGGLLGGLTGGGNPTEMLSRLFTLGTRAMKSRTPDAEAAPTSNLAASLMGLYVKARLSKMGKEMKGRSAEPSSSPEDLLASMIGQGLNIMKERNAPAIEARKADLAPEKLLGSLTGLASGLKNAQTGQVVEKRAAPLTKARAPNEDLLASLTGLAEGLKTARTGQAVGKRTANPSPLMANPMMNLIGLGLKARMNQGQQKEQRSEEPLAERLLRGAELLKASSGMAN